MGRIEWVGKRDIGWQQQHHRMGEEWLGKVNANWKGFCFPSVNFFFVLFNLFCFFSFFENYLLPLNLSLFLILYFSHRSLMNNLNDSMEPIAFSSCAEALSFCFFSKKRYQRAIKILSIASCANNIDTLVKFVSWRYEKIIRIIFMPFHIILINWYNYTAVFWNMFACV